MGTADTSIVESPDGEFDFIEDAAID